MVESFLATKLHRTKTTLQTFGWQPCKSSVVMLPIFSNYAAYIHQPCYIPSATVPHTFSGCAKNLLCSGFMPSVAVLHIFISQAAYFQRPTCIPSVAMLHTFEQRLCYTLSSSHRLHSLSGCASYLHQSGCNIQQLCCMPSYLHQPACISSEARLHTFRDQASYLTARLHTFSGQAA